jgi:hypothetical protein
MSGYVEGACEVAWRHTGHTACAPEIPAWVSSPATVDDIAKEMNSFYSDGANLSLPMIKAYVFCAMKLGGATKAELDGYLKLVK